MTNTKQEAEEMTSAPTRVNARQAIMGVRHPMVGEAEQVTFKQLTVDEVRFQVRNLEANTYVRRRLQERQSEEAVRALGEVVDAGDTLDPLIVWQSDEGQPLWVIDGHHRIKALKAAGTDPEAMVWVQRFQGKTEADARRFALSLNKRTNLNMTKDERYQELWVMLVCGEATGSVRELASLYGVSKSVAHRMKQQVEPVRKMLGEAATNRSQELTTVFIRREAPLWKDVARWRSDDERVPVDPLNLMAVELFTKHLSEHLGDQVLRHPLEFKEAVLRFIEELGLDAELNLGSHGIPSKASMRSSEGMPQVSPQVGDLGTKTVPMGHR